MKRKKDENNEREQKSFCCGSQKRFCFGHINFQIFYIYFLNSLWLPMTFFEISMSSGYLHPEKLAFFNGLVP